MTETECPTCGTKCNRERVQCGSPGHLCGSLHEKYTPLSHNCPDLTKLREVRDRHSEGRKFSYDNYVVAIDELWGAVEELLEQEIKP